MVFHTNIENISEKEQKAYEDLVAKRNGGSLAGVQSITATLNEDGFVDIDYKTQKMERIRRITGYLVGTIDRWNDAKRAEEHDRVKHSLA